MEKNKNKIKERGPSVDGEWAKVRMRGNGGEPVKMAEVVEKKKKKKMTKMKSRWVEDRPIVRPGNEDFGELASRECVVSQ